MLELLVLFLDLKSAKNPLEFNFLRNFGLGILAGLTILCKQTSGIIFVIFFVLYKMLNIKEKGQIKDYLKIAGARVLGILLPVLIFIIYLVVTGSFYDFIDYAISGVRTFSNSVSYTRLFDDIDWGVKILAVLMPLQIIAMLCLMRLSFSKKDLRSKEWFQAIFILLAYSISALPVIFPISDRVHFCIGIVCTLISFAYSVYIFIDKFTSKYEEIKKKISMVLDVLSGLLFITVCISSIYSFFTYVQSENKNYSAKHFKYIPVDSGFEEEIRRDE